MRVGVAENGNSIVITLLYVIGLQNLKTMIYYAIKTGPTVYL